jgi:AbrB family looped-hinge helix DNA binding protein
MTETSTVVKFLSTTRLGEKGQMTIPKEYRAEMGLKPSAPISVLRVGRGLILLPKQTRFERLCDRIAATLAGAGITESDLQETLPEARRRVVARRYLRLLDAPPSKGKAKRR